MPRGDHRRPQLHRDEARRKLRLALIVIGVLALIGYVAIGCTLADAHLN